LGLGLYIAKQLVELHDGTLEADSDGPGRGATFVVRLPLHGSFAGRPRPRVSQPIRRLDGLRVLLVDDDDDARELLTTVLTESGASTVVAKDASGALALFGSFRPDVLVSDIGLPEEDG